MAGNVDYSSPSVRTPCSADGTVSRPQPDRVFIHARVIQGRSGPKADLVAAVVRDPGFLAIPFQINIELVQCDLVGTVPGIQDINLVACQRFQLLQERRSFFVGEYFLRVVRLWLTP